MAARRVPPQARRSIADKAAFHENHKSGQRDLSKNRISVALSGSVILQMYFAKLRECVEPSPWQARHLSGQGS